KARELGFDLCGIAPAEPSSFKTEFREWLARGYHGEMEYMAQNEERRLDPREILPGAKSIVVVAMNYYTESDEEFDDSGRAIFARYARGDDYHDVMTPRLRELLEFIKQLCPTVPTNMRFEYENENENERERQRSLTTHHSPLAR